MTAPLGLTLAALGFAGAFVSGLVGGGGMIVMIPLVYYVPPLIGVGTLGIREVTGVTMVQAFAATLTAMMVHRRSGMVHQELALIGGSAMAMGSFVGAITSRYVDGSVLLWVFALVATSAVPLMLLPVATLAREMAAADVVVSRPLAVGIGGGVGVIAGLLGASGGFLLVPLFIVLLRVPLRVTIASSLAVTAIASLAGLAGKLFTGQVPLWPTVSVLAGSLIGAQLGARISQRTNTHALRALLVFLIGLSAVRVWITVLFR